MAYDRSQIGTKTARTSLEKMDTRTPRAYIEVEATGARAAHTDHRDSARITSAICASVATFHSKDKGSKAASCARRKASLNLVYNHFPPLHTHLASLAAHTHTRVDCGDWRKLRGVQTAVFRCGAAETQNNNAVHDVPP